MTTQTDRDHKEGADCDPTTGDPKTGGYPRPGVPKEGADCDPTTGEPKTGGLERPGSPA